MDYSKYRLQVKEYLQLIAASAAGTLAISWLFYDSLWGGLLTPVCFLVLRKIYVQRRVKSRRDELAEQFMDALKSVSSALSAGFSMENAWKEAQKEMLMLHGRDSMIVTELAAMNRAISMNVPMENTLKAFAVRTGNEDIYEFSEVFRFSKRSGGDFVKIIETTVYRINGKYDTQKEIAVLVAAKKMEQKVMDFIPVFIIAYLKLTDTEYLDAIYGNPVGILFMTGCLAAYAGAIMFSEKILDIRV